MSRQKTALSGDAGYPDASEEWSNIEDSEERRRVQNRVAQRKYRARLKTPSRRDKERDSDLAMSTQDSNDPLELENLHSSRNDASALDQDISASAPWMMNSLQAQDSMDLQSFPYPCNTDYGAVLKEPSSNFPTSSTNYGQYPGQQSSSFLSLQPNGMGNNNNESNGYKSLPTPPSPYIGTQLSGESQDHRDTSEVSSNKRRSELHLPQREYGASTKDVPRAERDTTMSSKSSKTSSSSQSKNAHSADDRGHKNGQVRNNRTSKAPTYDASKDLTKTCKKVQKQLLKQAYEQGRKEATASFGKERSRLQSKAQHLMDAVIETYGSGVRSGVFEREVKFDKQLQAVMVHLQSLSRWDACAVGGRVSLHDESDSVMHSDTASDNGSE